MRTWKIAIYSTLLMTTASSALYPQDFFLNNRLHEQKTIRVEEQLSLRTASYDDILELIEDLESDELEAKLNDDDDLDRINQFLLSKIGRLRLSGGRMRLSDEEKKYILNEYLRNISHIKNKDYQIRIWILGEGPESQAFDDAVCDFFDIGDPILNEYREFGISEDRYRLLKVFRDQFKAFSDKNDVPQEFINTPEWERIMNLAKEVLKAFNYQKTELS